LYILPTDWEEQGHIVDEDILKDLIKYMPANVHTTMLVDCCYSGTIGDLPYVLPSYTAQEGGNQEIETYYDTDTRQEMIEKEKQAETSNNYKEKKKARSKWKQVMRLPSVAATYVSDLAKDMSLGFQDAAHAARDAAREAQAKAAQKQASDPAASKLRPAPTNRTARSVTPPPSCSGASTTETRPQRTKTREEIAKIEEELARRAAVANSKREAARERSRTPPRHTKSVEDIARDDEEAARKAAVLRSKTEAARERSKTPPPSRNRPRKAP
jgi:hypothetical protein